ncbi:MAG: acyltransferase [Sphingomonas sp.]|uniref:acyltransferase family protein n=1 Tax=Sphingomonas sp. TaxID=28214 RepID=UPI00257D3D56|nr:acyltransferase [Sphingomonas sp.]MBQ1480621.1 acyltransferase [Sphingomonas sp.]
MLNNLQALRALAAYLIVFAHLHVIGLPGAEYLFPGVDLFFVISGFVMVHTTAGRRQSPAYFMAKRVARIVPLYWSLTLLVSACAIIMPEAMTFTRPDLAQLVKSLAFVAYDKHDGLMRPLLAPGWTLNYEMFFYVIFAATLPIKCDRVRVGAACGVLMLLVTCGLIARPSGDLARFYTSPVLGEFALGMLLGLSHKRISQHPLAVSSAIMIGAVSITLMLTPGISSEGPLRLLAPGLPAAAVVYAALNLDARGVRCDQPWVLRMGGASYSLYLTHLFVVTPASFVLHRIAPLSHPFVYLWAASILAVATAVAILCYIFFEVPIAARLRRLRDSSAAIRLGFRRIVTRQNDLAVRG